MTIFYPGQRVRILCSPTFPELAGTEGTILERAVATWPDEGDWYVSADLWGSEFCPHAIFCIKLNRTMHGAIFCPASDQLEPILIPGIETEQEQELTVPA